MKKMEIPSFSSPSIVVRQYLQFKGLDQSADESQIDPARSPLAVNMISDAGGSPQKRIGWRTVRRYVGRINGIFAYKEDGQMQTIVHAGAKLYRDGETPEELMSGLADSDSTGFYMGNKLYILTGAQYIVYDGTTAANVSDNAYVPTTSYGRSPSGGGYSYERVNLLSPWRYNKFLGDGESKVFQLDLKPIDAVESVVVDDVKQAASAYTVDLTAGTVTFITAPPKTSTGLSNVEVKFKKETAGHADKVLKCTICATYGQNSENYVFLAGNPDEPNREYYSGLSDPSYFPDLNYNKVGSEDWPILNFLKFQGDLVTIKEDNQQEWTIYHHTMSTLSDGTVVFPTSSGVAGLGACAKRAAQNLLDDVLFLTPRGVFARVNMITLTKMEQGVRCRSKRINPTLINRTNLKDAVSVVWKGYYILCIGDECYVADSNQPLSGDGYEWYYWRNVPARCFAQEGGVCWFGTADGRLCRFNDDLVDPNGDVMMEAYNDDGAPIEWVWATKMDNFGNTAQEKTLTKDGCVVMFKTAVASSADIYIRTEKDFGVKKRHETLGILDFNQIDFTKFTFNALPNNIRALRSKIKKFKLCQIILKGNELNESFGVLQIVLRASMGKPVKR